jgi:hypothetical protein
MDNVLESIRGYIAERVTEGFYTREEIVDDAADYANDEFERVDLDSVIELTADELIEAHYQAQTEWTAPTDCDKLDVAFADLDAAGIVARQNFTCCQTCGHSEIQSEIEWTQQHRPVEGYVFYHMQDTDSAREGYGLFLAYGAVDHNNDQAFQQVGWRIVERLKQAGLEASWDGDLNKRIFVQVDWKRRRL